MNSLGGADLSGASKDDIIREFKQSIVIASTQEMLAKMTEKCFAKCISKPGTSLDSSEQKCVAMCMDRYMDSWKLVASTLRKRLEEEANRM